MIYRCDDCGEVFNYPSVVKNGFSHPFGDEIFTEDGCPFCGSLEFTSVVYCDCGIHLKPRSAHLSTPQVFFPSQSLPSLNIGHYIFLSFLHAIIGMT